MTRRDETTLWLLMSLLVGFLGALFIETTPDSSRYLDQAHNWAAGLGLVNFIDIGNGYLPFRTYVWPPFYSIILGVLIKLGFSGLMAATTLCAVGFAATTTILLRFLQIAEAPPTIRAGFLSLWIVWAQQQSTWHSAWSETVFLPLMALAMTMTVAACRRHRGFWLSLAIGLVCAVCAMTRHIGVFTICAVFLSYVISHRYGPERGPLRNLTAKLAGAGLGFVSIFAPYWVVMKSTRDEALSLFVSSTQWPFLKFVGFLIRALAEDFGLWIALAAIVCAAGLGDRRLKNVLVSCRPTVLPIVAWPFVYLAFLLLSAWTVGLVGADASRYSLPMYLGLMLLFAVLAGEVWKSRSSHRLALGAQAAIILATLLPVVIRVPESIYRQRNSERTVAALQRLVGTSTEPIVVATLFHRVAVDKGYVLFPFPPVRKEEAIPRTSNFATMLSVLKRSNIAPASYFYIKTPDDRPADWDFDLSSSDIVGSVDGYVVYKAPLRDER